MRQERRDVGQIDITIEISISARERSLWRAKIRKNKQQIFQVHGAIAV